MLHTRKILAVIGVILAATLCLCACGTKTIDITETTMDSAATITDSVATATDSQIAIETPTSVSTPGDAVAADPMVRGSGEKNFIFSIVFEDGSTRSYTVYTDEATVGKALTSIGMIDGKEGEYGLVVSMVDGEIADYEADGAYWAFYIDGEYAQTGVDATEIVNGSTYQFVYTPATAQ